MHDEHGRRARKGDPPIDAETIALLALQFLAEEPERLGRFLALTGLGPAELKEKAGSAAMLGAVLDYLLGDESLLLVFAATKGVSPQSIGPAQALLARLASGRGPPP